jgi:outer membrane protein OmpA-like peptidoglycan-associated protein
MNRFSLRLTIITFLVIVLHFCSITVVAQDQQNIPFKKHWYVQPAAGISQYFGDLNKKDFWNQHPRPAFSLAAGYQINPVISFRPTIMGTKVYSERTDQDLRLQSNLLDAALNITVNFNELFGKYNEKRLINIYFFGGAGVTNYKSTLDDIATDVIVKQHSGFKSEFFVPLGFGGSIRLNHATSLNFEYGDRTTFNGKKIDFIDAGIENNDHYSYASAGVQFKLGAKDTDRDGIWDKDDQCITTIGKYEHQGCPDIDGDGIADKDDACPDIAGKPEFKGCPDTDGDNIPDLDDACPDVAGLAEFNGCPDKDNDGVTDKEDNCPDVYGKKEFNGCPDRDGDGVIDKDDLCPDVRGLVAFAGCPDTDGDSIPDNKDNCPDVAGVASTSGCPEKLNGALYEKIVYFDTDEWIVLAKNIIDLNEIAAFMNENPDATISIAGHADWRESDEYNMLLSERRADYVINYLRKKGMITENVDKSFWGKRKPIADNSTEEGMALNRRVEIRITK